MYTIRIHLSGSKRCSAQPSQASSIRQAWWNHGRLTPNGLAGLIAGLFWQGRDIGGVATITGQFW